MKENNIDSRKNTDDSEDGSANIENLDTDKRYISPGAEIADDVILGEYVKIGPEVVIRENCEIEAGVEIRGRTIIGRNNYIARGALLGFAPQHLDYNEEATGLVIGDNNYIGPRCRVARGPI